MNNSTLTQQVLENGSELADRWRLQWRWRDAHTLIQGLYPVAAAQDDEAMARVLLLEGRILLSEGLFGKQETFAMCEKVLDSALTHAQATNDTALIGTIWDAKGFAHHAIFLTSDQREESEDELSFFERGLTYHKEANHTRGIAESLFHIGIFYRAIRHDHSRALTYFEEAYDLAKQTDDLTLLSYVLRHIAFARHDAGEGALAYAAMAESLRLREEAGFASDIALAHHMMAYAEADYGDKTQAIPHLERAKKLFASVGAGHYVAQMTAEIEQFREM